MPAQPSRPSVSEVQASKASSSCRSHLKPWLIQVAALVWHGVPHLLLITLAVVIVHSMHPADLEATEAHFRREAMQRLPGGLEAITQGMDTHPMVRLLDVSATMRIRELEPPADRLDQSAIDRLQGQRPLDRCSTARLIQDLARRLQALGPSAPKVVAIDLDLAPLQAEPPEAKPNCGANMAAALNDLRRSTTVVAILMARQLPDERQLRNKFWAAQAGCSRTQDAPGLRPLYLASPQVFHPHAGPPLDFPYQPHGLSVQAAASGVALPASQEAPFGAVYPSVGNVVDLALRHADGTPPHPAMVALCMQMEAQPLAKSGCTLEDGLHADRSPQASGCRGQDLQLQVTSASQPLVDQIARMEKAAYNWPLLNRGWGSTTLLSGAQLAHPCSSDCLKDDHLTSPVLVLGVDAGAGRDTYMVPNIVPDPLSGAGLHGLHVLSLQNGQQLWTNSAVGVLADLASGLVFLVFWVVARLLLESRRLSTAWPGVAKALLIAMPLLLVFGAAWLIRRWMSPWLLDWGFWVNPVFVLAGLTLHAYAEAWHGPTHAHHDHAPDFSFGLAALVQAWRRRSIASEAPRSGAGLTTLLDAGVMALLAWSVLLWGLWLLLRSPGIHAGWTVGLALCVVCLIGGWRQWSHRSTSPTHEPTGHEGH